ncbi:MAG: hypothetical protein AAFV59_07550 [Pseudomonadota bacterium]
MQEESAGFDPTKFFDPENEAKRVPAVYQPYPDHQVTIGPAFAKRIDAMSVYRSSIREQDDDLEL